MKDFCEYLYKETEKDCYSHPVTEARYLWINMLNASLKHKRYLIRWQIKALQFNTSVIKAEYPGFLLSWYFTYLFWILTTIYNFASTSFFVIEKVEAQRFRWHTHQHRAGNDQYQDWNLALSDSKFHVFFYLIYFSFEALKQCVNLTSHLGL